jgi:hypothetical protein
MNLLTQPEVVGLQLVDRSLRDLASHDFALFEKHGVSQGYHLKWDLRQPVAGDGGRNLWINREMETAGVRGRILTTQVVGF